MSPKVRESNKTLGALPPTVERRPDGGRSEWQGQEHFTRAELRYGIFFRLVPLRSQNRLPRETPIQRLCWPSVPEAVRMADKLRGDGWEPEHVWDFRDRCTVVVFGEAS